MTRTPWGRKDLIDTLWNVKVKNREIFAQGTDDLIDTLWNVKSK